MSTKEILVYFFDEEAAKQFKAELPTSNPLASGRYKEVSENSDGTKVYLRYKIEFTPAEVLEKLEKYTEEDISLNFEMIAKDGLNVAPFFGAFKQGDEFVQVQGKVPGDVIQIKSKSNAATKFLTEDEKSTLAINKQRDLIIKRQQEYNLKMHQQLVDAPQNFYDKLLSDAKILAYKYGQKLSDSHTENFTFSPEKGFFFLDLDPLTIAKESGSYCRDYTIFKCIGHLFDNINYHFTQCYDENTKKQITKANQHIIRKYVQAALNCDFKFDPEDLYQIHQFIKHNCTPEDATQISNQFVAQYIEKNKDLK